MSAKPEYYIVCRQPGERTLWWGGDGRFALAAVGRYSWPRKDVALAYLLALHCPPVVDDPAWRRQLKYASVIASNDPTIQGVVCGT